MIMPQQNYVTNNSFVDHYFLKKYESLSINLNEVTRHLNVCNYSCKEHMTIVWPQNLGTHGEEPQTC